MAIYVVFKGEFDVNPRSNRYEQDQIDTNCSVKRLTFIRPDIDKTDVQIFNSVEYSTTVLERWLLQGR